MNKQERIAAAKERLYNRYPDRDEVEINMMKIFNMSFKEVTENFK